MVRVKGKPCAEGKVQGSGVSSCGIKVRIEIDKKEKSRNRVSFGRRLKNSNEGGSLSLFTRMKEEKNIYAG